MKVVLINPPQTQLRFPTAYISFGLAYIGAVLEEAGVEVEVKNLAGTRIKEVNINKIPDADVFGITSTSATYPSVVKISKMLKRENEKVVIGGVHPTILPEETLRETGCDYVITGEAEFAFRDLVLGTPNKQKIIHAGVIKDLDVLPFPARHLFKKEHVVDMLRTHRQREREKATTMLSSRGCPYNCSFCCGIPQTKIFRWISPERVVMELKKVMEDYGVSHVRFVDDLFTLPRQRVEKLCNLLIKENLSMTWACLSRADATNKEVLALMKRAGCKEISLGIESGSQHMLNLMNKNVTVGENYNAIQEIKKAGIDAEANFIYGFPGETENDREATKKFLITAKPDKINIFNFCPFPGSDVWRNPDKYNLQDNKAMWFHPDNQEDYNEGFVKACKELFALKGGAGK